MSEDRSIKSLSIDQLEAIMTALEQPKYRASQLYKWLHTNNATSYDEMTNLPKSLRQELKKRFPLEGSEIVEVQQSVDGTRKYLLQLSDGLIVEMVGIIDRDFVKDDARLTVCCSSQIGCSMECAFCATGKQGFSRNLTADEIVDQVVSVGRDFGMRVSNVVLMGQGEPFQNYDAVMQAIRRMNGDEGLAIGARHITVSTSGIIDGIRSFAQEPEQFRLAISLHSANQATRDMLMPRLKSQSLESLKEALIEYSLEKGRRVTFEYMLLDGINDSEEDLVKLVDYCDGINVHINLLPFNSIDGSDFKTSPKRVVSRWESELSKHGIPNSVRKSKGSDIAGACGQLKNKHNI